MAEVAADNSGHAALVKRLSPKKAIQPQELREILKAFAKVGGPAVQGKRIEIDAERQPGETAQFVAGKWEGGGGDCQFPSRGTIASNLRMISSGVTRSASAL
jgi:hypothetical protein